jgi:2-alkyl-3-oxoalkanoate reductase
MQAGATASGSQGKMRIFVTGATGVIGRRAVPLLLADGHEVTVMTWRDGSPSVPWARDVRMVRANLFDPASLTLAVRDHDVVINLATHIPSSSFKMMFRPAWRTNDRIRREGSRNLVDAALAGGVERFVQESFGMSYPDRGDSWIDESVPLDPVSYNRTVRDAEESARRFTAAGRTGVVLRFAAFYGPDSMVLTDMLRALRWGWAPLPGGPERFISSLSHDDAATAVVHALRALPGEYNITDNEPLRRREFFGALAALGGARAPRFLPRWMTPLFGDAGKLFARSLRIANAKFRGATNWVPRYRSAREGLAAALSQM